MAWDDHNLSHTSLPFSCFLVVHYPTLFLHRALTIFIVKSHWALTVFIVKSRRALTVFIVKLRRTLFPPFPILPYLFPASNIFFVKLRRALTILLPGPDSLMSNTPACSNSLLSNTPAGPDSFYSQIHISKNRDVQGGTERLE